MRVKSARRAKRAARRGQRTRGPGQPALSMRALLVTGGATLTVGAVLALWVWPGETPFRTVAGPGHGRGMSQLGALANAQEGQTAENILGHYYPGATLGTVPANTVAIRLTAQDDATLDTFAGAGLRVAGQFVEAGQAAHLTPLPTGGANVVVTVGCDGDVLWQAATDDPWVYPVDPGPNRPAAEHLTLCGGSAYRGALGVATENRAARTVNRVDVEDYLLGVIPAEVQANWADKGGAEALRAQAIAARSYVLAEHRFPFAQSCDTTDCQVYPGTAKEDPRAAAAVVSTAGTVLLRDGRILRSEYSSAPGGGEPADIYTFDVGPALIDLAPTAPTAPIDPRTKVAVGESPIDIEYRRIGGAASKVGQPLGPEMALPQNAGTYRTFTNGVIISTATLGTQVIDFTTLLQLVPDPPTKGGPPSASVPPAHGSASPDAVAPEQVPPVPGPVSPDAAAPPASPAAGVPPVPEPGSIGAVAPPVPSAAGVPPVPEPASASVIAPPVPSAADVPPVPDAAPTGALPPLTPSTASIAPVLEPASSAANAVPELASTGAVAPVPSYTGVQPVSDSAPSGDIVPPTSSDARVVPVSATVPIAGIAPPVPSVANVPTVSDDSPSGANAMPGPVPPVGGPQLASVAVPFDASGVPVSERVPFASVAAVPFDASGVPVSERVPFRATVSSVLESARPGSDEALVPESIPSVGSVSQVTGSVSSGASSVPGSGPMPSVVGVPSKLASDPVDVDTVRVIEPVPADVDVPSEFEAEPSGADVPSVPDPAPSGAGTLPVPESVPSGVRVPPVLESAPPVGFAPPANSVSPGSTVAATTAATPTPRPTPGIPIPSGGATSSPWSPGSSGTGVPRR